MIGIGTETIGAIGICAETIGAIGMGKEGMSVAWEPMVIVILLCPGLEVLNGAMFLRSYLL